MFLQIMDEFVQAVMARWPNAVLQFEDFNLKHAHPLLNRYKDYHTVFNDDIQASFLILSQERHQHRAMKAAEQAATLLINKARQHLELDGQRSLAFICARNLWSPR